ncbi:MAG: hypothetical protein R3C53_13700 [Pirellulaceae bacterium]
MSTSPYAPPPVHSYASSGPAAKVRPTSVTVIGILAIAFGLWGFFGGLVSMAFMYAVQNMDGMPPNPVMEAMYDGPYGLFMNVVGVLGLIIAIVLVVAGGLLLAMKKAGRTLAFLYAFYTIVMAVLTPIFMTIFVLMPMMQNAGNGPEAAGAIGGVIGGIVGVLSLV